jgi:glycerol-3-phosphate O-acyltransferase
MLAAGATPGVGVDRAVVADRAREISRALKLEFIFEPGVPFERLFDAAVRDAVAAGFLTSGEGNLAIADAPLPKTAWRFAASLIQGFVECYAVVVDAVARVTGAEGVDEKIAVARLLEAVKAAVVAGDVAAAEAASKVVVENAVALVVERGLVVRDGKLLRVVVDKDGERGELVRLLKSCAR